MILNVKNVILLLNDQNLCKFILNNQIKSYLFISSDAPPAYNSKTELHSLNHQEQNNKKVFISLFYL